MFRYSFETDYPITSCENCPCVDTDYAICNIAEEQIEFHKPDWCPLREEE